MDKEKNISGNVYCVGKYSFRNATKEDSDMLFHWRNLDRIRLMCFNSAKISYENHLLWFDKMLQDEGKKYFIFTVDRDSMGVMSFSNFNKKNKSAEWNFYLGNDSMPNGTGTMMCKLGLELARGYLKLKFLEAKVIVANAKSINIHEKLSFQKIQIIDDLKPYFIYKINL